MVIVPPSPVVVKFASRAAERMSFVISPVVSSRSWRAFGALAVGRIVVRYCFTSAAAAAGVVVWCVGGFCWDVCFGWCCWERAFLLGGFVVVGKIADQISSYGG